MDVNAERSSERPHIYRVSLPTWLSVLLVVPSLGLFAGFLALALTGAVLGGVLLPLLLRGGRRPRAPHDTIELDPSQYRVVKDERAITDDRRWE